MLTTGRALTWSIDSTAVVHRDSMETDVNKVFIFCLLLSTKLNDRKKDIDIKKKKKKLRSTLN